MVFVMKRSVLIIEDDQELAGLVAMHMRDLGCSIEIAHDGLEGFEKAVTGQFGLIILDLMLPTMDGLQICHKLRLRETYAPILMLTAKSTDMDRITGLEAGADDYLTKPFNILELNARVKAIFRRIDALATTRRRSRRLRIRNLSIDIDAREAAIDAKPLALTAREFDLLSHFAAHPGQVFTRQSLLDSVWGYQHDGFEHTVNSHINRLRSKLEKDPKNPEFIQTVWGAGYKMVGR